MHQRKQIATPDHYSLFKTFLWSGNILKGEHSFYYTDWKAWKMGIEKALRLVKDLPRVALNNIKNSPMDQKKPVGIKKLL